MRKQSSGRWNFFRRAAAVAARSGGGDMPSLFASSLRFLSRLPFLHGELLGGHAHGLGHRGGGVRGHDWSGAKEREEV